MKSTILPWIIKNLLLIFYTETQYCFPHYLFYSTAFFRFYLSRTVCLLNEIYIFVYSFNCFLYWCEHFNIFFQTQIHALVKMSINIKCWHNTLVPYIFCSIGTTESESNFLKFKGSCGTLYMLLFSYDRR